MAVWEYLKTNFNSTYAVAVIGIAIIINIFFGLSARPWAKKLSIGISLAGILASGFLVIYSFIQRGVFTSMVVAFGAIHLSEIMLVLFISLNLLIFLSLDHYKQDNFTKMIIIFLFSLASLLFLILSRNFLAILVAWSLFVLGNFQLVSGAGGKSESPYIIRFFLSSLFSLLLMLVGFSYLYSVTDFKNLQQILESGSAFSPFYAISFILIMGSLLIFMSFYPLHGQYLKLVKRTSSMASAFIWFYYLPAGFIILLKFREVIYYYLSQNTVLPTVILALGALCTLGPAIGALSTKSIKRILGFLFLSFMGLSLLGFSLLSAGLIDQGRLEWLILANILNLVLCLIPVWAIFFRLPDTLDSLTGFISRNTYLGVNLVIIMLGWLGMAGTFGYLLRHHMVGPLVNSIAGGHIGQLPLYSIIALAATAAAFLLIAANTVRLLVFMFRKKQGSIRNNVYYHHAYYVYITLFTLMILAMGIWGLLELAGLIPATSISINNPGFLKPPV
ncbi:MAG: hypothetical protein PHN32_00555 [Actinomycetota bacterium]|jgi:NADH:ubiquinone oxidoreductase subunit 2 (subunit N)|nr:hypothetical protein [Actinomycetota bacterium]